MNIIPFNENVLVRPFATKTKTDGGVIIPDTVQERPSKATVLAVSEELNKRLEKLGIKYVINEGDVILHVKNCGIPIVGDNGEGLFMLRYVECLSKIDSNGTASGND